MATRLWARLENEKGGIEGAQRAWEPDRQFLWEVVHDNRGLWRKLAASAEDLQLVRRIDTQDARGGKEFLLDPGRLREVYERFLTGVRALGADVPRFRLVAPQGTEAWAAVSWFSHEGQEYALVGGWTGPLLRTLLPTPDQTFVPDTEGFQMGPHAFRIRSVPFLEYFGKDFESLLALLRDAERRHLKVRFVQA